MKTGLVLFAFDDIGNLTNKSIMLASSTLVEASGVRIVGAYIAPTDGEADLGILSGWPPGDLSNPHAFSARSPLNGFQLPANSDKEYQVLLKLQVTSLPSGFASYRVSYKVDGGSEMYAQTKIRVAFARNTCLKPDGGQSGQT